MKNNFEMILVEDFVCEYKKQLERKERYYIETMKCVNKIKPAQTKEEHKECRQKYKQEHKVELKEQSQKYRQENLEEIKKYHKQYYNDRLK